MPLKKKGIKMISMEGWIMIRQLFNQGLTITEIANITNLTRKTVSVNLKKETAPKYSRKKQKESKLSPYKDYIRAQLEAYNLTAERLFKKIKEQGYKGGYGIVAKFVHIKKKEQRKQAVLRFETLPGEQAQADWGYFGEIYDQEQKRRIKLYCFFMILGYSRALYIEFFEKAHITNFLIGHNNAFKYFGGYTKEILYDNLKSVVIKRALRSQESEFNKKFMDFAGYYGINPILCRPYKPNTKGKVENSVLYARQNFFAGEEFASLNDINKKSQEWLKTINARIHSTTKQQPIERLKLEGLLPIRDKKVYDINVIKYRRVFNDCHFSYGGNFYSVPYKYAGKEISVKEEINEITVFYRQEVIAQHVLSALKGQRISTSTHFEGLREVRMSYVVRKPKEPDKSNDLLTVSTLLGRMITLDPVQTHNLALYEETA
jgi:transposase